MSRSLGKLATRLKRAGVDNGAEAQGRAAHAAGKPITACPHYDPAGHGVAHAWRRGWRRAAAEARGKRAGTGGASHG